MELIKHKQEFNKIIAKYKLDDHDKAEEIAVYLTKSKKEYISPKEFAVIFPQRSARTRGRPS